MLNSTLPRRAGYKSGTGRNGKGAAKVDGPQHD